MNALSIVKNFNDLSLEVTLAIYSHEKDYSREYYVEVHEGDSVKPLDEVSLQNLKAIFNQEAKVQSKPITFSLDKILYCNLSTRTIIWKTMTGDDKYVILQSKRFSVPAKDLLWAYHNNKVYIFTYQEWKGSKTKVSNAILPNVMGDGHICKGTAKFPFLEGDLIEFCKQCENIYSSASKGTPYKEYIKLWNKKGIKALWEQLKPTGYLGKEIPC